MVCIKFQQAKSGNFVPIAKETVLRWIIKSWEKVTQESIRNSFKIYQDLSDLKRSKILIRGVFLYGSDRKFKHQPHMPFN